MYAFFKASKGVGGGGGGGELIMETHCRSMAGTISGLQTNSGKMMLDNQNVPPACKRCYKKGLKGRPYCVRFPWTCK